MATARPRELFSQDLRSLGLFRVCLGALVLADAVYRALDARAFYTEAGVLPTYVLEQVSPFYSWSLCMVSDGVEWQLALLVLLGLSGICIVLGRGTRVALAVAAVLLMSFRLRNPPIVQIADTVLGLYLMWALFMPVSERLVPGRAGATARGSALTVGGVAFQLQLVLIYVAAGVYKSMSAPWVEGSILIEAMRIDPVATDFGRSLLDYPGMLYVAGIATIPLELVGPLIAYVPWRHAWVRTATAVGFMGFHVLGIGLLMRLGLVPFVLAAAWTAFLPPAFWDGVLPRVFSRVPAEAPPPPIAQRRWANRLALGVALMSFATYLHYLPVRTPLVFRKAVAVLGAVGVAQQSFSLWTRPAGNRHFVFAATLVDGAQVDLATGRPLDWSGARQRLPNNHWYKLFQKMRRSAPVRRGVATWYVQEWNDHHPPQRAVSTIEVGILQAPVRRPAWWLALEDLRVPISLPRTRWRYSVEMNDGEAILHGGLTLRDGPEWEDEAIDDSAD